MLGIAIITVLVLGIGLFQSYGGKSFVDTLYEIFILIIGGLGVVAIQLIFWPERFLPKSVQQINSPLAAIEQKSLENLRPLSKGEIFESELFPHQKIFHRGDPVLFRAGFKGKMVRGYLATYIKKPDGAIEGVYAHSTLANPSTGEGNLNGEREFESRWSWTIPSDCKTGPYRLFIHAGNFYRIPSRWVRFKVWGLHLRNPRRTDLAHATQQASLANGRQ